MSAERTRILFGDDSALAQARPAVVARPDFDVVLAATTEEARAAATLEPHPRVAVLPAVGEIDGVAVCQQIKSTFPDVAVILALPIEEIGKRDACFIAGADDVIFVPSDANDIAARLDARVGPAFRGAPRASVPLAVHVQGSLNGPVVECRGLQISREALMIQLPTGIASPPPNTLVRAIFTLYEGGTLTVWARFATPTDLPPRTILRFVGLSEHELKALDYFVDFYVKSASARAAVEEVTDEHTRETAARQAGIATNARVVTGGTNVGPVQDLIPSVETLTQVAQVGLDVIASAAATMLTTGFAEPPEGFSVLRFRQLLAKLASAETMALKGQSTYGETAGDIMLAASAKLRLFELIAQLKTASPGLDKAAVESLAFAAIGEAQQVHKRLEADVEARVKTAQTDAVKEIGMLNVGLVNVCFELKRIVDVDILGKGSTGASPSASPSPAEPVAPTRWDRREKPADGTKASEKDRKSGADSKKPAAPAGKGRTVAVLLFIVAGGAAAVWSNLGLFVHREQTYLSEKFAYAIGPVHVVFETQLDHTRVFVVDDSWKRATQAERDATLTEMASRAAKDGFDDALVETAAGDRLASKRAADSAATTPADTAAPQPSATPTTATN